MEFNRLLKLIQKYDRQGPRYTSYPTVPQWTDSFGEIDTRKKLKELQKNPNRKVALYTHLPFCEEKCYFCACNVVITKKKEIAQTYIQYLKKELSLLQEDLLNYEVSQLHWGGGTPTYLTPAQMEEVFGIYLKYFHLSSNAEISLEVDPRVTTLDHLKMLKSLGFNRLSMGVQDFDEKVQAAIHRNQTYEQTLTLHHQAKKLGFESINMDFVYGLPYQTQKGFQENLSRILELKPDRIAFYNYAHVPWMVPWQKLIPMASLPQADLKLELLCTALELFEKAGYVAIGFDHFALAKDELVSAQKEGTLRRNFMGYTTQRDTDLFGFGVSAIGELEDAYVQNQRKLAHYYKDLDQNKLPVMRGYGLNQDDLLRRDIIWELMCNLNLKISDIEEKHGISFFESFQKELNLCEELVADGFLEISKEKIQVTDIGRIFLRNICMVFDQYFQMQMEKSPKRYSRTV